MSEPTISFEEIFNTGTWKGMQKFSDGTLQSNDGTNFKIHKVVLSQRSAFFRGLFTFELNPEPVVIPNIDREILESILVFIYTGTIALNVKNVCDMMIASDYLLLDDLLKKCRSLTIQNLRNTNCLPLLKVASRINRLDIFEECFRYVLVHFKDILETSRSGVGELPFEIMKKLLESKSLNIISERSAWEAIVLWTEADISARLPNVPILLTFLRLEEEVNKYLEEEILAHTIVSSNPHILGLMLNIQFDFPTMKHTILSQQAILEPSYKNLLYSNGPRIPNRLYLVARHTSSYRQVGSELFLSYDDEFDFWRKIETHVFCFIDKMQQIGKHIFIFEKQKIIDIFDILEEEWFGREFPRMPTVFGWTIILGGKLYHISGLESRNIISTYKFERNCWESITTARDIIINGAVALKEQIFVLGMSVEEDEMLCQAYDPEKNIWISLPPPNMFREAFFLSVFHEQVFVIPHISEIPPKTVEVYDPLQNTWMPFPDLPFGYESPRAIVVDDKIIVCEDTISETRRFQEVHPPVYWDSAAHLWRTIDESSPWYHIERYSFLVLDDCRIVKDLTTKNRRSGDKWKRLL